MPVPTSHTRPEPANICTIQVIPIVAVRQKNEIRRVRAEKDILLNIISPFMLKFFYSNIREHNLYLLVEYLPCSDLYATLHNIQSLPQVETKIYTALIVSALEFLLSRQVIHPDLKPDNILVDFTGRFKLTDFRLSFFAMIDRSIFDDACLPTPDYTSLQIIFSQPHTFTNDYCALRTSLFQFLTRSHPLKP
jgi:serine/threonine protein kinase